MVWPALHIFKCRYRRFRYSKKGKQVFCWVWNMLSHIFPHKISKTGSRRGKRKRWNSMEQPFFLLVTCRQWISKIDEQEGPARVMHHLGGSTTTTNNKQQTTTNNHGRTACSRAADLVCHLCWVRSLASWTRSQLTSPPPQRGVASTTWASYMERQHPPHPSVA